MKSTSFVPTPDRSKDLRAAFGRFGTGVTVVTTLTSQGPLGMTANSFSSISLEPALVLWSPARSSQRHDAFTKANRFCIHVLSSAQLSLARHFATEGYDFEKHDWHAGPDEVPSLKGCLAEFHCDRYAVHPAGDHSLILGQIRQVVHNESSLSGLIFERGHFGSFRAQDL